MIFESEQILYYIMSYEINLIIYIVFYKLSFKSQCLVFLRKWKVVLKRVFGLVGRFELL